MYSNYIPLFLLEIAALYISNIDDSATDLTQERL